uniref:Immunoglobulin subtype domain-containing protein n=1 Tax=Chrysemys picta bellii TaxID=8478 RepID=A0A8C3I0N6_CHRPI
LSYPKPSISLRPRGGVALGQSVTIRCECRCQKATFLLYKLGNPDHAEARDQAAEFPIDRAGPGDTGTYRCRYLSRYGQPRWSENSDPVRLVVGETPAPPPRGTATALRQVSDVGNRGPGLSLDLSPPGSIRTPAPPWHLDFTQGNIVRLGLGAGVLLALGLILAESCHSRERRRPWTKRAARRRGGVPPPGRLVPLDHDLPHWGGRSSLPTRSPRKSKAVCEELRRDLAKRATGQQNGQ